MCVCVFNLSPAVMFSQLSQMFRSYKSLMKEEMMTTNKVFLHVQVMYIHVHCLGISAYSTCIVKMTNLHVHVYTSARTFAHFLFYHYLVRVRVGKKKNWSVISLFISCTCTCVHACVHSTVSTANALPATVTHYSRMHGFQHEWTVVWMKLHNCICV